MKRMSNHNVTRKFISSFQEVQSHNGNLSSNGNSLYSYAQEIARKANGTIYILDSKASNTTSRHISTLRYGLPKDSYKFIEPKGYGYSARFPDESELDSVLRPNRFEGIRFSGFKTYKQEITFVEKIKHFNVETNVKGFVCGGLFLHKIEDTKNMWRITHVNSKGIVKDEIKGYYNARNIMAKLCHHVKWNEFSDITKLSTTDYQYVINLINE